MSFYITITNEYPRKTSFSDENVAKARLFTFQDHSGPRDTSKLVWERFKAVEPSIRPFGPQQDTKACREVMLEKLARIAELSGMEEFEAIDRDRLPKDYHSFLAFINQSASVEVSVLKEKLVDWNSPVRIKLIFLPDSIT